MRTRLRLRIAGLTAALLLNAGIAGAQDSDGIRLVLQITVDGLRGDLLNRYGDRLTGGFRYLLDEGTAYSNAHYQHANTETIVGHTTLATGAFPADHGMVGNVWYDREDAAIGYNIEDPNHPLLPVREGGAAGAQLDPAQKASRTKGRSPRAILASTFGDELAVFYAGRSKIYGVSGKDRSAVAMAGHTGKAFWYSTDSGDFVTSDYYYDAYPDWAAEWNAQRKAQGYADKEWRLLKNQETYLLKDQDDRPYERDLKGYGRVFPHRFGGADSPLLFSQVLVSPYGDRLAFEFAQELVRHEELGKDDVPDYLSISFSGVDAVNHFFGPSSLENEDVVLRLDQTLAELFHFIDEEVGLDHTLIVLSADHGMAEMPEYMTGLGMEVGRIYSEDVVERANAAGKRQFGVDSLARFFFRPSLYLDRDKIAQADLDYTEVERAIAAAVTNMEGIAAAVPMSQLPVLADTPVIQQVRRNAHPSRSGDIYVAQEPYWFLFEKGSIGVMHGSPWRYDTHVPVVFAGADITAQELYRLVHPVDVAPTLAAYLGLKPPSSSQGTPLVEVLE